MNGFARRMAITKEMFDQVRSRWRRLGLNRKVPSIKVFEELKSSMER